MEIAGGPPPTRDRRQQLQLGKPPVISRRNPTAAGNHPPLSSRPAYGFLQARVGARQRSGKCTRSSTQPGPGGDGRSREEGRILLEGKTRRETPGGWQLTVWEPPPRPRPGSPVVFEPSLVADGDTAGCKRLGAGQLEAAGGCFPLTLSQMKWLPGLASQSCLNGKRPVSPMEH